MVASLDSILEAHGLQFSRLIGQGATSRVFLCGSLRYKGEQFVIKRIDRSKADNIRTQEWAVLQRLSNPHIVKLYVIFEDEQFFYLVLEYCSGGSLMDWVESSGPLKGAELYSVCPDIIMGLEKCHSRNVAHRDIKPQNILIGHNGLAKLADFGLSEVVAPGEQSSRFLG
jgi:serine/threonine protein kinase